MTDLATNARHTTKTPPPTKTTPTATIADGTGGGPAEADPEFETYRRALTAHCYRMLGGAFESEDAVQETMVRAWRNFDRFEGRSSVRSWLYRIATNVCLDMLGSSQRRARPMDLVRLSSTADAALPAPLPEVTWIEPMPNGRLLSPTGDPADQAVDRESIRLAFIAASSTFRPASGPS